MRENVHTRRIEPNEKRFVVLDRAPDKISRFGISGKIGIGYRLNKRFLFVTEYTYSEMFTVRFGISTSSPALANSYNRLPSFFNAEKIGGCC